MFQTLLTTLAGPFLRQALTSLGTVLVAHGWITSADWATASGALITLGSLAWMAYVRLSSSTPAPATAPNSTTGGLS